MATNRLEHFILRSDDRHTRDLEFYLNANGEIFVNEHNVDGGFFFTINPPDWEELKKFIDEQFKSDK